ncbi:hypothetical protein SAMN04489712_104381 [Thermomonospora echinospora]|uniref:Uncharacterized protein n=1 Tax=Thermomonospora echinospora TaxID=1992 RepID=A0A1H5Z650_9ACTN|nr:hypothetical protein [Thermomonospora echinospora]SEG31848.1 hypothetical protein SAMN04489712_104381 [Thermomonospora echinospora]
MNRRADRIIAVAAVAAVAVVPTVLLVAIKAGQADPKAPGELPSAAAYRPGPTASRTPSAPPSIAAFVPAGTGTPVPPTGGPSATPTAEPFTVNSFTRTTDGRLRRKIDGGGERVNEASRVVLAPRFGQSTEGLHERTVGQETTSSPLRVLIKGDTLSAFDGTKWTKTKLTERQLAQMKAASDPRLITFTVASLPGATRKGPNAAGLTRYGGASTVGQMVGFLPQNLADEVLKTVPPDTATKVEVVADGKGCPSLFTMLVDERTVTVTVRSTFGTYR